jgi:hypothetical protein
MRDRNCAVKKSIPPPVATDVDDAGKCLVLHQFLTKAV